MTTRLFLLLFLILGVSELSLAQQRGQGSSMRTSPKVEKPSFPASWVGEWQGTLAVDRGMREVMSTPFHLSIQPLEAGCYSWGIAYGEGKSDNRPYTMCPSDTTTATHWVIDEHNGILLDGYVHGNVFFSRFEVMGSLLFTRDELIGDTLYHEIITGPMAGTIATGDTVLQVETPEGIRNDSIPVVNSYKLPTRQWAKLTRQL
ncbi:MAG: hypothetical protein AB8F78_15235 [Saprospiraceae bacterium]